jgi:hypothetical protein
MGKLREGTATKRERERDEYIRYNVDYKLVSERYEEKERIQGRTHRIRHKIGTEITFYVFLQFLSLIRSVHSSCAEETITPYIYTCVLFYVSYINVL